MRALLARRGRFVGRFTVRIACEGYVIAGLRERKRAASRAATVDAAYALFAERSYDHVTVADICEAAQIAPRTFFRYFAGKEDLLAEPVRLLADEILAGISAAPAGCTDADALRGALRAVGGSVVAQRQRLTAFRVAVQSSTHVGVARFVPSGEQERAMIERLVARRPDGLDADWRLQVLVAIAIAGFRVWFQEMVTAPPLDPLGHLDEVLVASGLGSDRS
jgi:AcrR family transcriptional regulator